MGYILAGGIVLLLALAGWQSLRTTSKAFRVKLLRYGTGGGLAALTVLLAVFRRIDLAFFTGAAAFSVLARGRLGPFVFESQELGTDTTSKVRSRYFAMRLDHDTGAIAGEVVQGQFVGQDLMALGEDDTRTLLDEVSWDPDSLSLLESWLDVNRAGWREYFAGQESDDAPAASGSDPITEAYAVLGLEPGADEDAVRLAHRELMKGVHPDHGGSSYLAARINEARDRLLKHLDNG